MKKLYIAYGSNLNIEQMAYRCRTAKLTGTGFIENWTLQFRSMLGPAYATILPMAGSKVPVAIWEIDELAEQALDIYEGYPRLYNKKEIEVITANIGKVTGIVYIMNEKSTPGIPSKRYIEAIAQGYYDNKLNIDYLIRFIKHH